MMSEGMKINKLKKRQKMWIDFMRAHYVVKAIASVYEINKDKHIKLLQRFQSADKIVRNVKRFL